MKLAKPQYMMATKAFHQLGEISSEEPDICIINEEDEDHYIGSWVFGLGFFGVKFPKETTHHLTEADVKKYDGLKLSMCSMITGKESYSCGTLNVAGE